MVGVEFSLEAEHIRTYPAQVGAVVRYQSRVRSINVNMRRTRVSCQERSSDPPQGGPQLKQTNKFVVTNVTIKAYQTNNKLKV